MRGLREAQQIKEALIARGIDPETASYEARQAATLDSRARKQEVPREALHEVWQATAREVGLDLGAIVAEAKERAAALNPAQIVREERAAAMQAVTWALEHLSQREQTFAVTDLQLAAMKFSRKVTEELVSAAIDQHRATGQLVDRGENDSGGALVR